MYNASNDRETLGSRTAFFTVQAHVDIESDIIDNDRGPQRFRAIPTAITLKLTVVYRS